MVICMIVFNGGLTIEQVRKFEKEAFFIYDRVPYLNAHASRKNTFDYVPRELYSAPIEEFKKYIAEEILNKYIGVGNYDDYRIEYRLPRRFIDLNKIIDFLYYEPYDEIQIAEFRKKYSDYMTIPTREDEEAKRLMLKKSLIFNGERIWI